MSLATVAQIRDFGRRLLAPQMLQQQLDGARPRPTADDLRAAIEACLNDLPQAPDSTTLDVILQPHGARDCSTHSDGRSAGRG